MPRTHARLPVVIAALLLGTGAPLALGQNEEDQSDGEARRQAQIERAHAERALQQRPMISLDFPGGPLEEYVTAVRAAAAPDPVNIIIKGDADGYRVNPVKLENVAVGTALNVVAGWYRSTETNENLSLQIEEVQGEAGQPVYLVYTQQDPAPVSAVLSKEVLVLSIRELTTPLPGDPPEVIVPAETILTALETAAAVSGEEASVEIKYHPDSGLLILAGSSNALSAADRVVKQIREDVGQRRMRAREIQAAQGLGNPEALEEQLADARTEAELAAVRAEAAHHQRLALEERLREMQANSDQGVVSADEVREAEMRAREAEAAMREQQIHARHAEERVARAAEALERAKAIAAGGGSAPEVESLRAENAMLRDRLAAMEVQIAQLRARLEEQAQGGGAGGGGGTR